LEWPVTHHFSEAVVLATLIAAFGPGISPKAGLADTISSPKFIPELPKG
jgi:hypothetical protein